jgi:hypothetical protein
MDIESLRLEKLKLVRLGAAGSASKRPRRHSVRRSGTS